MPGGDQGPSRLIKTNDDKALKTYISTGEPDVWDNSHSFYGDPERWDRYADLGHALAFKKYIRDKDDSGIFIFGHDTKTGENLCFGNKKIHRWCKSYVNARLAALYKLKAWKDENPDLPSNMWTFTVPHDYNKWGQKVRDGANHLETWENIKQGWRRLYQCQVMREKQFVLFYEPHPHTGYPHIHLMCFDDYTQEEESHIKELWASFTGADLMEGSKYAPGKNPKSLIAYLMKYLSKQMFLDIDTWTDSDWLFNAIAHKYHYRLFSASRNLSEIMRLDKHDSTDNTFEWDSVMVGPLPERCEDDETRRGLIWRNNESTLVKPGKLLSEYPLTVRKKYPPVPVYAWGKIYGREISDKYVKPSLAVF